MFLVALSVLLLAFIVLLLILAFSPNLQRQHPLLRASAKFLVGSKLLVLLNRSKSYLVSERFNFLDSYLGKNALLRLVVPAFLFLALGLFVLGPILVGPSLGLVLGLLIACAYFSRVFLHFYLVFRDSLLAQIERMLLSIRNNLSAGMTLDYAVTEVAAISKDEPIASDLRGFLVRAETNFLESFPIWLNSLRHKFHLSALAKSSQLLRLELHYTNNQEEAFLDAVNSVHNSIAANKKQGSTLSITLFTLDFIVLAFFAVLFYVIPSFSINSDQSWWQSAERPCLILQSGFLIWGAYLLTVLLALRRQE